VVKSHLNEPLLQQIAAATGGFYLPLRGADTMDTLYDRGLAPLPKSEGKGKMIRRYHEQYQWPLAAAILLLLAEMFLPERRSPTRRAQGQNSKAGAKSESPRRLACLLALSLLPAAAHASPASALRDYQSGNFTNALQEFTAGASADERPAPGFQRGRRGVSRDEF
jgi:Ca-activated chloride channel homolog